MWEELTEKTKAAEQPTVLTTDSVSSPPTVVPAKASVAQRPHWVTIVLGSVSPLISIGALSISLISYHFSVQSVQIGQRAYVHTDLAVENTGANEWKFELMLENLGNTPARVSEVSVGRAEVSDSRNLPRVELLMKPAFRDERATIGSKQKSAYCCALASLQDDSPKDGEAQVVVLVDYSDVFGNSRVEKLTCIVLFQADAKTPYIEQCDDNEI